MKAFHNSSVFYLIRAPKAVGKLSIRGDLKDHQVECLYSTWLDPTTLWVFAQPLSCSRHRGLTEFQSSPCHHWSSLTLRKLLFILELFLLLIVRPIALQKKSYGILEKAGEIFYERRHLSKILSLLGFREVEKSGEGRILILLELHFLIVNLDSLICGPVLWDVSFFKYWRAINNVSCCGSIPWRRSEKNE